MERRGKQFFADFEWNQIFQLPFKTKLETNLQWLQFQILHRIVPTNLYLFKLEFIDTPSCTYCNNDIETIYHLFLECFKVKELWLNIEEWLLNRFNLPLTFDRNSILFGKYKKCGPYMSRVYNLITLTIKYYIFSTNFKNNSYLSISALQQIIRERRGRIYLYKCNKHFFYKLLIVKLLVSVYTVDKDHSTIQSVPLLFFPLLSYYIHIFSFLLLSTDLACFP